jgi:hypothetical protein
MTDEKKPLPPLWVPLVVPAGILAPPVIAIYVVFAYGWGPAAWLVLAVVLANISSRAARKYFRA